MGGAVSFSIWKGGSLCFLPLQAVTLSEKRDMSHIQLPKISMQRLLVCTFGEHSRLGGLHFWGAFQGGIPLVTVNKTVNRAISAVL